MSPFLVTSQLLHTPFHTDDKNHDSNHKTQSEMKYFTYMSKLMVLICQQLEHRLRIEHNKEILEQFR